MFGNIAYRAADLLAEDAEALVNTVNCKGVMGKGLALQFKKKFGANFDAYAKACKHGAMYAPAGCLSSTFGRSRASDEQAPTGR